MLGTLRRIIQEVSAAEDLAQALDTVVRQIRLALGVDVCSAYLVAPDGRLVLMATEGLNPDARYQVRLNPGEGLVGLVAERAEPVNLDNAPEHPRYKYVPETGEERFHAFVGIPMVHQRQVLGVLVAQHGARRRFEEDHVAFLITLAAQLAGAIRHAELSGEITSLIRGSRVGDRSVRGVAGAPGVAAGRAWVVFPSRDLEAVPDRRVVNTKREVRRFRRAVERVQNELHSLKERMGSVLPAEERVLFDAYIMLLGSESLNQRVQAHIRQGNWAPGALRQSIHENAEVFEEMEDDYLRERAQDIRDLGRRILRHLEQTEGRSDEDLPGRVVLMGDNVSVAELADIPQDRLLGVVSGRGSASSHVAILARALGIPAVVGVADIPFGRVDQKEVIVDGYAGRVFLDPSEEVTREYLQVEKEEQALSSHLAGLAKNPAQMADGESVAVYVNGGLLAEINSFFQSCADGIGLYRTEFPFMLRDRFPGEDEQCEVYRRVLEAVAPRPVTMRTLDVGGDKALPYFPVDEENPFLGWRGIRLTLDHPEIFLTQLRAMLRANAGLNNLQILFPMVSSSGEVAEARTLLERAWYELLDEDRSVVMPRVGVMIEVPSAVYLMDSLSRQVDFVSVGTNDLVQYLLAVDRNNPRVADLYRSLHPAVLRALQEIVTAAREAGIPAGVCGEMASDPAAVVLLLGLGFNNLSVSLAGLPRVKWVINSFSRAQAADIARQALEMEDPTAVRALLEETLIQAGLKGLVRPGQQATWMASRGE